MWYEYTTFISIVCLQYVNTIYDLFIVGTVCSVAQSSNYKLRATLFKCSSIVTTDTDDVIMY